MDNNLETTVLYGGRVKIKFEPIKHRFYVTVDGKKQRWVPTVTRVTSIIDKSKVLMGWAIRNTIEVFDKCIQPGIAYSENELEQVRHLAQNRTWNVVKTAGDLGTLAHQWLKAHLSGKNPLLPPKDAAYRPCIDSALEWLQTHNVQFLDTERPVYSLEHNVCGIMDGSAYVNSILSLVDFKTGNNIYSEARLQTAAYVHLREEEGNEKYEQRVIIRLGKNGEFQQEIYPQKEQEPDWNAFLAALNLQKRINEIERLKDKDWVTEL